MEVLWKISVLFNNQYRNLVQLMEKAMFNQTMIKEQHLDKYWMKAILIAKSMKAMNQKLVLANNEQV